jgi:sarcosine oxidase subunit alpha
LSTIRFSLDGDVLEAQPADTIAAALLRNGVTTFTRSIKYHRPRGPFCFSGSCGQCLLRVDGVPSLPACRIPVAEGMTCERQNAPLGSVETDLLRATDFVFSSGLDHHHLMIGSRLLGKITLEVARRLAGLGHLPSRASPAVPGELRKVRVAVVGAGPAGIAAAKAAGPGALLIERDAQAGGSALLGIDPAGADEAWVARETEGLEILLNAEAIGLYAMESAGGLLAVRTGGRLLLLEAERVIIATGGMPQPLPFAGVDRPGVHAARGLLRLHRECGLRVGASLVVVGDGKELVDCARALKARGYALARVVSTGAEHPPADDLPLLHAQPLRALGNPVRALDVSEGPRLRCDAIALAWPPSPAHELATGSGAQAGFIAELNGFPVQVNEQGRTSVPWIWAAGRVCGLGGAGAVFSGTAAGEAVALP